MNRTVWYKVWDRYNKSDVRYEEIVVAAGITKKALDEAIDEAIHEWMDRYCRIDVWYRDFEVIDRPPRDWLLTEAKNARASAVYYTNHALELEALAEVPPEPADRKEGAEPTDHPKETDDGHDPP